MENKEILKALSFIAAELYIQNEISYYAVKGIEMPSGILSIDKIPRMANHFNYCFTHDNAVFNPAMG